MSYRGLRGGHADRHDGKPAGRDRGVALLEAGTAPADVIALVPTSSFDSRFQTRQYGVVDLSGRAAGFTGSSAQEYRADRQGAVEPYVYSIQGNILTGARVLDQAEASFRTRGCDLSERLMLALEAGAENAEGDSRCTTAYGLPSDADQGDLRPLRRFTSQLPSSPLSYTGQLFSVRWCVRVRLFLRRGREIVQDAPFVLGSVPTSAE